MPGREHSASTRWRPLYELGDPDSYNSLVRVIMAGYTIDQGVRYPRVGEAFWGSPDEGPGRWIWESGYDVDNPLAYQPFPNFPIASENSQYVIGHLRFDKINPIEAEGSSS